MGTLRAQEQLSLKQQADKLYERYEYYQALRFYLKVADKKHPDGKIAERIADCYRQINEYTDAEDWYEKAVINPKISKISHYYYAEVLLRNQKFEQAKQQYTIYFKDDKASLQFKLATCDSAAAWMKQPSRYLLGNSGVSNTTYSDWGADYYGKAGLVFTSDRDAGDGTVDYRTGNNWFKLYQTDLLTNKITPISLVDTNGNAYPNTYHAGPMTMNKTGDTAYITITTEVALKKLALDKRENSRSQKLSTRRLMLVTAHQKDGKWVVFGEFPYNNVQQYSLGNAALAKDGRLLYFSSDMPGGEGKTDIWYCEKHTDGTWGKPVNCGKSINTKEEDSFPYLDGYGTLYFASKGLPGMGGYDIYSATGQKANWSTPVNLKYPINTTSDDFYLVTPDGNTGYLSSNRDGGKGSDDIYTFGLKPDTLPAKPVIAQAEPPKVVPPVVEPKADINIKTIYYNLNKSFIRPDAAAELDRLVKILNEHPQLSVQLSSYTDSRASFKYNIGLSKRRAKAAVAYLVKRGIDRSRLTANGYGKTHLVNQCAKGVKCTEAEHQLNRRTEFRLIGM